MYMQLFCYHKLFNSFIGMLLCCECKYTSVDIMPELKRNILNFGYGINFKYEGMLSHWFDRFYIVTKFALPTVEDLKFSTIQFDSSCKYLDSGTNKSKYPYEFNPNLRAYCKKIVPFVDFYKKQIEYYNSTAYKILTKEISLILPTFPKERNQKRGIITSLLLLTLLVWHMKVYLVFHIIKGTRHCIKHLWQWKVK